MALGIVLIAIPLGATSLRVFGEGRAEQATRRLAQEWIAERGYEIGQIDANGNQVVLVIHGSGERGELAELGSRLGNALNQSVEMTWIVVPSEQEVYVFEPQ